MSFLPGVHEVDKVSVLYIKNASNFIITGYNVSSTYAAKIVCRRPAILAFFNIVNLVIKHLSIVYCGFPLGYEESVAVYLVDITSLKVSNVSVENSTGYGIIGINILGNSSVSHSRFIFNNYYTFASTNCSYGLGSCEGGNMLLYYGEKLPETLVTTTVTTSVLSIDSCLLSDGVDVPDETKLSGGLAILGSQELLNQYYVDISICNVVSTRNVAKRGANFLFDFSGNFGSINITNSTSSMANYLSPDEALHMAGFQFIYSEVDPLIQIPTTNKLLLHISDSKFYDNNGGGFNFQLDEVYSNVKYHVLIKNCSFQRNMNLFGSAIRLADFGTLSRTSGLEVLMEDTSFTNHMIPDENYIVLPESGFNVITVNKMRYLEVINCTFAMNKMTALQALDSTLYFGGHVIFSGNNGRLGGALMLQGGSTIYLMPHTYIQIVNNHAKRGGGTYIEDGNARMLLSTNGSALPIFQH